MVTGVIKELSWLGTSASHSLHMVMYMMIDSMLLL